MKLGKGNSPHSPSFRLQLWLPREWLARLLVPLHGVVVRVPTGGGKGSVVWHGRVAEAVLGAIARLVKE